VKENTPFLQCEYQILYILSLETHQRNFCLEIPNVLRKHEISWLKIVVSSEFESVVLMGRGERDNCVLFGRVGYWNARNGLALGQVALTEALPQVQY